MEKRKRIGGLALAATLLLGGAFSNLVTAREMHKYEYNEVIAGHGKQKYTYPATKRSSNGDGLCMSKTVSGDNIISVRIERTDGGQAGPWVRIGDGETKALPNEIGAGLATHMRLKSSWNSSSLVQARGYWSPDAK